MSPEQRIISFMDHLKTSGKIRFQKEFYDATGISRQYMRMVDKEGRRLTTDQITNICKVYKINANWIFGVEKNMYRL